MSRLHAPFWRRLLPMLHHRVLAIDQGSVWTKVLVADLTMGKFRVVHRQTLGLDTETGGDIGVRLRELAVELGAPPVALVLPQHRCISQTVDLPADASSQETRGLVEEAAVRLSGLRAEGIQYEYRLLPPYGKYANPCWLTLCKADEVGSLMAPFEADGEDTAPGPAPEICDVISGAQALVNATRADGLEATSVLAELGADSSTVAVMVGGATVFATSLAHGSQRFGGSARVRIRAVGGKDARSPAGESGADEPGAATGNPGLDRWHSELTSAILEWLDDHPQLGLTLSQLPVYLCGGAAESGAVLERLNSLGSLRFQTWTGTRAGATLEPRYCVAYGAALQALGQVAQPVSLLPVEQRTANRRRAVWEQLQAGIVAFIAVLFVLLGYGTWINSVGLVQKQQFQDDVRAALATAGEIHDVHQVLTDRVERIRPILLSQRRSVQTLEALDALQRARGGDKDEYWFVLFADEASYFSGGARPVVSTNGLELPQRAEVATPASNDFRFVLELCTPSKGEALRQILRRIVSTLEQEPVFARVDSLPPDQKQERVDPAVAISNQVFAVLMEVAPPDAPARTGLPGAITNTASAPSGPGGS